MSQLKLIYNNDEHDFSILSDDNLQISAIINRNLNYDKNVFYQSINVFKRYPDNNFEALTLKDFILSSADKIITKVVWIKDEAIINVLEGNIEPQWSLSETPFIQEVVNFKLID